MLGAVYHRQMLMTKASNTSNPATHHLTNITILQSGNTIAAGSCVNTQWWKVKYRQYIYTDYQVHTHMHACTHKNTHMYTLTHTPTYTDALSHVHILHINITTPTNQPLKHTDSDSKIRLALIYSHRQLQRKLLNEWPCKAVQSLKVMPIHI